MVSLHTVPIAKREAAGTPLEAVVLDPSSLALLALHDLAVFFHA